MALPTVRNVPRTPEEWNTWAWDHRDSHDRIRRLIQQQYNVQLLDYQIEPISQQSLDIFLDNNDNLHNDMNSVLGLVSTDLTDVDMNDPKQVESWINLHFLEHFYAEAKLGG